MVHKGRFKKCQGQKKAVDKAEEQRPIVGIACGEADGSPLLGGASAEGLPDRTWSRCSFNLL